MENQDNIQFTSNLISDEPKIGFLEAFYGVIFFPKKTFEDLYHEDGFTVLIYGVLAVFLSNLGKITPNSISLLGIIGAELAGFFGWFFVGFLLYCLSMIFKTPNHNFAKLLGFTGLSNIPFLLMAPVMLIGSQNMLLYKIFYFFMFPWTFILFCLAISKSLQLEAWRVFLLAFIPFIIGMTANIIWFFVSSIF